MIFGIIGAFCLTFIIGITLYEGLYRIPHTWMISYDLYLTAAVFIDAIILLIIKLSNFEKLIFSDQNSKTIHSSQGIT